VANQSENKNHRTITEQEDGSISKFENHLLSVRNECQRTIERNSHQHPTFYNVIKRL
jgi:hypothetical protein